MQDEESKMAPAVHIITPDGDKWGICLSRIAKWIAGIGAALSVSVMVGAFSFAWQSNARLSKLDDLPKRIESLDGSLQSMVRDSQARSIKNSEDIAEIKGRVGALEKEVR